MTSAATPGRLVGPAMDRIARRLGISPSQAYTVTTGAVLALVLGAFGLPGVLRGVDHLRSSSAVGESVIASPTTSPSSPAPDEEERNAGPDASPSSAGDNGASTARETSRDTMAPSPTTSTPVADPVISRPDPGATALFSTLDPSHVGIDDVAVGDDGSVYVVTDDGVLRGTTGSSALVRLDRSGVVVSSWSIDGQPPTRERGLTGVATSGDGAVWMVDASTSRLLRLDDPSDDASAPASVATVPDVPACGLFARPTRCESGLVDRPPVLEDVTVAPDGTVYVADRGQGLVWRADTRGLTIATRVTDRIPGEGPRSIAFMADGSLVALVSGRLGSLPPGASALVRFRPGSADAAEVVADFAIDEAPSDVVAGTSGRVYVTVPSSGLVADIGTDRGDRIDLRGRGADPTMESPTGIALAVDRLYVTDPGPLISGDARAGLVYTVAVLDRPVD